MYHDNYGPLCQKIKQFSFHILKLIILFSGLCFTHKAFCPPPYIEGRGACHGPNEMDYILPGSAFACTCAENFRFAGMDYSQNSSLLVCRATGKWNKVLPECIGKGITQEIIYTLYVVFSACLPYIYCHLTHIIMAIRNASRL